MSPASRRIFLYWLLLLVPTLVVGGLAIQLLRREQARIATQAGYAQDARRAAAMTRARLVVENVELLVGDVQAALLDTLASESDGELDVFLEQWEKNNPLVRTAFLCRADGELIRPSINAPGEDPRGFARRFSSILRDRRPWAAEPPNLQMKDSGIEAEKAQTQSESRTAGDFVERRAGPVGPSRRTGTRKNARLSVVQGPRCCAAIVCFGSRSRRGDRSHCCKR